MGDPDYGLEIGKPGDLGEDIKRGGYCDPTDFLIIQRKWMERTKNTTDPREFLVLKDWTTRFIGERTPDDTFLFLYGVLRIHVGITRKGDTLTIGDLNSRSSEPKTTVITSNPIVPNP